MEEEKITVLYIISSLKKKGGPQSILNEIVDKSSPKFSYNIVTLDDSQPKWGFSKKAVLHMIGLKVKSEKNSLIKKYLIHLYSFIKATFKLFLLFKKLKPNVVVADGGSKPFILASTIKPINKITRIFNFNKTIVTPKLIFRFGNIYTKSRNYSAISKNIIKRIEKYVFKNFADKIIFPSKAARKNFLGKMKIRKSNTKVINNPIDLTTIDELKIEKVNNKHFQDNLPSFVAVGELISRKGYSNLIKAFNKLSQKAQLFILGEGPIRKELKELAISLDINDKVHLIGHKNNPYKYMYNSLAFVHPALWEGFGIVIIEAMACGIVPIVTKCPGGAKEIIDNNKNGLLVEPNNITELSKAMSFLLQNKEKNKKMSRAARDKALLFSSKKIVAQYEKAFKNL